MDGPSHADDDLEEYDSKLPTLEELNDLYEILSLTERRKSGDEEVTPSDNIILYLKDTRGMKPVQTHETFDWKKGQGEYKHVLAEPGFKVAANVLETEKGSVGSYIEELGSYIVDEEGMSKLSGQVVSVKGSLHKNERKTIASPMNDNVMIRFKTDRPGLAAKVRLSDGTEEDLSKYKVEKTHRIYEFEGTYETSYRQKVTVAELVNKESGKKLIVASRTTLIGGGEPENRRAWVTTEKTGKKKYHIQEHDIAGVLSRQLDEIDTWHSYRLDEHKEPEVTIYTNGNSEKMDVYKAVDSEKKRIAECANFLFAYAEKTENGIRIMDKEYSYEDMEKYKGLLDFAKIDPKKAKDVKKDIDSTMYV